MGEMIQRCDVVDENGNIILMGMDVVRLLSKSINGELTHVKISYYKNLADAFNHDNLVYKIFPFSQCYFYEKDKNDRY